MCFWLLYGTTVMYRKGKRVPPGATMQRRKKNSNPNTGLEQWVKTLNFNKGETNPNHGLMNIIWLERMRGRKR